MEEQINLLAEDEIVYEPATTGARFADYIIDSIAYSIRLMIVLVGLILSGMVSIREDDTLFSYVCVFTAILGYYTLIESITQGKTLGKYITGTRAVKEGGSPITLGDAFMRSICRLVPFEVLCAFGGNPWHDRWTKTMVIKERR